MLLERLDAITGEMKTGDLQGGLHGPEEDVVAGKEVVAMVGWRNGRLELFWDVDRCLSWP